MQVDYAARELTVKLVYYGPAFGGKTSNLRAIQWLGTSSVCGPLMTLDTKNDRTLFFDMLPMSIESRSGLRMRIKLFAVPGQLMHDATRRLVLRAADGVAFVADSRRSEADANRDSFLSLKRNLEQIGIAPEKIPIVIQFNKRDLDDIRTDDELAELAARSREPIYKAVATRGHGVTQTLSGLVRETWKALEREHHLEERLGVDAPSLMDEIEATLKNELTRRQDQ